MSKKTERENLERKTSPGFVMKSDAKQGIVDAIFSVFGIIDQGNDIVHPGSFARTFVERSSKVKILDQHRTDTILSALGRPLAFRELGRDELPETLLAEYPDATGGALASIQFLMNTPEGEGAFIRINEGAVDEWSFAYRALDYDFSNVGEDENARDIRNLRTIALYDVSPVLFGMNPATTTTAAKESKPEPEETENFIHIRMRDPDDFQEGSIRTIDIDKDRGITARIGRLEGETVTTIQAYLFDKEKGNWTIASALAWVEEHGKTVANVTEIIHSITSIPMTMESIITAVVEALKAADIDIVNQESAGPDDDTTHLDEPPVEDLGETGPGVEPSTDDDLLWLIEIEQQQIKLMEI